MNETPATDQQKQEAVNFLAQTYQKIYMPEQTLPEIKKDLEANADAATHLVTCLVVHFSIEAAKNLHVLKHPQAPRAIWGMIAPEDRHSVPEQFLKSSEEIQSAAPDHYSEASKMLQRTEACARILDISYAPYPAPSPSTDGPYH